MQSYHLKQGMAVQRDFPYFRGLWRSIITALFLAAFLPLIVIGGGMYYYAACAVKDQTLNALGREVRQHQKSVDRFLSERVLDLKVVSGSSDLVRLTRPGAIEAVFNALAPGTGDSYFTDLGIVDQEGVHRAYVGPYDLISQNYKDTQWFKAVMASDTYISDLFYGFRKVPHFIIAVKKTEDHATWIVRATIKADYFNNLISEAVGTEKGDAFLVNRQGIYQSGPMGQARMMKPSGIQIPARFDGVRIEEGKERLRLMVWLESVPWLSVVETDPKAVFQPLRHLRNVGFFVFFLGAVLIGFTVLVTTNYLVQRLEAKRGKIKQMDQHLRQANRMTLSLRLYKGFFQEMNEYMSNIASAVEWIAERNRDDVDPARARKDIAEHLEQIQAEIIWSRKTIHELIHFSQPADPVIQPINISTLLNDLVELFVRELYFNNIRISLNCRETLPIVRSDPSLLKQVFQNLMFNALEAIGKNGEIRLTTRRLGNRIRITLADSGPGISADAVDLIFEPLFSTHPKRLGLGLSICRDILGKIGGRIRLEKNTGKGAAFTVEIPVEMKPPVGGGGEFSSFLSTSFTV